MLTVGSRKGYVGRDKKLHLRVFLDKRLMEVYANDGAGAMLIALAGEPADQGVELLARNGTATLRSLQAWNMKPATFSLEHF
jgi:sucrose-6-phosphate hydrolase SacC (GH32 family)